MKVSNNPSAIQSKDMLAKSLLQLMKDNSYEEITITQITDHAQLARRTFYRNFDSKDEILQYHLSSLKEEYLNQLLAQEHLSLKESFRILLNLCSKHSAFLLLLKNNHLLDILLLDWTASLPQIHNKVLPKLEDFPNDLDSQTLEYLLTFNAGGMYNIIIKWIYDDMKVPITKMEALMLHLL